MAQQAALRKRQQIAGASRMMFLWVAGISALVGISLVLSIFLIQKLYFNEKVLLEKARTVSTLEKNNKAIDGLKQNVRVLNTNQSLLDTRAQSEDKPLQVILDALPSDANSSALGASLQTKLLKGKDITIESLVVDPVVGLEVSADGTGTNPNDHTIAFTFSVSAPKGKADSLRDLLVRLERSIRAVDIQNITIEMQGDKILLSASAVAFYEPAVNADLKDKVVKP